MSKTTPYVSARTERIKKPKVPVGSWNNGIWAHDSEETVERRKKLSKSMQDIERLLQHNSQPWAFLTAHHKQRTEQENQYLHARLHSDLQERGYAPVHVTGHYPYEQEGGVHEEPSYLVPGMPTREAIELGHKYRQEAVLTHEGMFNVKDRRMWPLTDQQVIPGQIPKDQGQSVIEHPEGNHSTFLINADWAHPKQAPPDLHPHLPDPASGLQQSLRGFLSLQKAQGAAGAAASSQNASGTASASPAATSQAKVPQPVGNPQVRSMANDYIRQQGLGQHLPDLGYPKLPPQEVQKKIADTYDASAHAPSDPETAKSYAAFARETKNQYKHAQSYGMVFSPWGKDSDPYSTSEQMRQDVLKNKHLGFYQGGDMQADHPLSKVDPETGLSYNDMFRAVHDLYGHAAEGYEFGPRGEYAAFQAHRRMYSPLAQRAMASETHMQNSWNNFGEHLRRPDGTVPKRGEEGWVHPAERPFAPQKALAAPDWVMNS